MDSSLWLMGIAVFLTALLCSVIKRQKSQGYIAYPVGLVLTLCVYCFIYWLYSSSPSGWVVNANLISFSIGVALSLLIFVIVSYSVQSFRNWAEFKNKRFEFFGLVVYPSDRQASLIGGVWLLTLLVTVFLYASNEAYPEFLYNGFLVSWLGDVTFFTIVGLVIALVTLRQAENEKFETRLSILFQGSDSPALETIDGQIRALGFLVSDLDWKIHVQEYNSDYQAYRVEVVSTYVLTNLFGDVDARDNMQFRIKPDDFGDPDDGSHPPMIGAITGLFLSSDSGQQLDQPVLRNRLEIKHEGLSFPHKFTVGREPVTVEFRYWLWVKTNVEWSRKPSRFTALTRTTIVNSLSNTDSVVRVKCLSTIKDVIETAKVRPIHRAKAAIGKAGEIIVGENLGLHEIAFGNRCKLADLTCIKPDVETAVLMFLPPIGHTEGSTLPDFSENIEDETEVDTAEEDDAKNNPSETGC